MEPGTVWLCPVCQKVASDENVTNKRTFGDQKREKYSVEIRERLLKKQENVCFWCGINIPGWVLKYGKPVLMRGHIDHKEPFSYRKREDEDNLCMACNICNQMKHSKFFDTEENCREWLRAKWANKELRGTYKRVTYEEVRDFLRHQ